MNDLGNFCYIWCIICLAALLFLAVGFILFIVIGNFLEVHNDRKSAIQELENNLVSYYSKKYFDEYYTDFQMYRVKRYCHKIAKIIICKSYIRKFR